MLRPGSSTFAQRVRELDRLSYQFPEQLDELLHDQELIATLKLASDNELVALIGYLDNVRFIPTPMRSHSSPVGSRRSRPLKTAVQEVPLRVTEDL